ncbi:MAG: PEGA domain-containing protein [Phycisphaerales bacterium]|nr:PEGA domain-containing protein [Phycisphaerales bacterium]
MPRTTLLILLGTMLVASSGCIRRKLSITTAPSGALVWVNDREVGRTPLTVDFTHYGTYDVRIEREGMEPVMTSQKASAPLWDLPGPDLVVEVMPFQANSEIKWHFDLEPRDESHEALVERARAFRTEASDIEDGDSPPPDVEEMKLDGTEPPQVESESPVEKNSGDDPGPKKTDSEAVSPPVPDAPAS